MRFCRFSFLKQTLSGIMTVQNLSFPASSTIKRIRIEKEDETIKRPSIDLPNAFVSASGLRFIHVRHVQPLHHQSIAHDIKLPG
jgi:hypothetical protein